MWVAVTGLSYTGRLSRSVSRFFICVCLAGTGFVFNWFLSAAISKDMCSHFSSSQLAYCLTPACFDGSHSSLSLSRVQQPLCMWFQHSSACGVPCTWPCVYEASPSQGLLLHCEAFFAAGGLHLASCQLAFTPPTHFTLPPPWTWNHSTLFLCWGWHWLFFGVSTVLTDLSISIFTHSFIHSSNKSCWLSSMSF